MTIPTRRFSAGRVRRALALSAVLLASSAAQAAHEPNSVEKRLAAAGFEAFPANTAKRKAEIALLKPKKLVAQANGTGFTYIYADPKGCSCLYMGDADDYAAYQKLAADQQIADENAEAAADESFANWNWGTWGPYAHWRWDRGGFIHGAFGRPF